MLGNCNVWFPVPRRISQPLRPAGSVHPLRISAAEAGQPGVTSTTPLPTLGSKTGCYGRTCGNLCRIPAFWLTSALITFRLVKLQATDAHEDHLDISGCMRARLWKLSAESNVLDNRSGGSCCAIKNLTCRLLFVSVDPSGIEYYGGSWPIYHLLQSTFGFQAMYTVRTCPYL